MSLDVEAGRIATLTALRNELAKAIASCESLRDLAALSREYRAVLAELDELDATGRKGSAADEIAERRRHRQANPHPKARAAD